jgi:N-acetylglucosaminyl-diphospho-decaprenol L-rhamnosyltransferase
LNTFVALERDPAFRNVVPVQAPAFGVSVVTVVYQTGPVLFEHLDSVLSDPAVDELILVDNGSSPGDEARLHALAAIEPRLVLVSGQGNIGFARGCNLGVSHAQGRWLLFLNPDAILRPGVVQRLQEARAARRESPVVVGARVLNPDGSEQRGGRRGEVTPVTTLLTLSHLAEKPRFAGFGIHREHEPAPSEPVEIPTISGACFLMTRADYEAVGGFDTGYFLHVEDVDLCWRVRRQGGVVLHHPGAEVTHYGSTSLTDPLFVEYWKGRGLARYFRKRADTFARKLLAWVLGPPIVAVSLARAASRRRR